MIGRNESVQYDGRDKNIPGKVVYEGVGGNEKVIDSAMVVKTEGDYTVIKHRDNYKEAYRHSETTPLDTIKIPTTRIVEVTG